MAGTVNPSPSRFEPFAVDRSRSGRTVRLYASPVWVRPGGKEWVAIEDLVTVVHDARTGTYRVAMAGESIGFSPRNRPPGLVSRPVVKGHRFGDIVDASTLTADSIEYDVTFSPGVQAVKDGWQFGVYDEVPLGVFLTDWRRRFGDRLTVSGGRAALDVTGLEPSHLDHNGELNLDPTLYPVEQGAYWLANYDWSWPQLRAGSAAGTGTIDLQIDASVHFPPGIYTLSRTALRFDTSAAGTPAAAVLKVRRASAPQNGAVPHVSKAAFSQEVSHSQTFLECRTTGYEVDPIGDLTPDGQDYVSPDIVAAGKWGNSAAFDLALCESAHDVGNTYPTAGHSLDFVDSGEDGPRLELTEAAPVVPGRMLRRMS